MNKLLNNVLLTVLDVQTLLSLLNANTLQVVDSTVLSISILDLLDSGSIVLNVTILVKPYLVQTTSALGLLLGSYEELTSLNGLARVVSEAEALILSVGETIDILTRLQIKMRGILQDLR